MAWTLRASPDIAGDQQRRPRMGVAALLGQAGAALVAYDPGVDASTARIDSTLLDWPRLVVDTRNLLDPDVLRRAGSTWVGGRAAAAHAYPVMISVAVTASVPGGTSDTAPRVHTAVWIS
ncbi:MAG: hypothetical protein L0I24_18510, partial [Pseudonocardia sp.]|nr:hypothetical protein [Pseudonocardia sp.]